MLLIALEGIDGAGKSTVIESIKHRFSISIAFPTKKFSILREYLEGKVELSKEASFLLFLSDIIDRKEEICKGSAVLDRYVLSTVAYAHPIDLETAKTVVETLRFPKPDRIILLDIPPEEAVLRKERADRYEADMSFLTEVRKRYLRLARERFMGDWKIINASKEKEEVLKEVERMLGVV